MADSLDRVRELAAQDSGLAVAVTLRSDGTPHASVVNAGVFAHPVSQQPVVGFVARGYARKLANLRACPHVTLLWRRQWDWVAVDGTAELAGPDDPVAGFDLAEIPTLLRTVYAAAVGGTADDWKALDDEMAREGHTAVLIRPTRIYANTAPPDPTV